jgi:hypothetical protein
MSHYADELNRLLADLDLKNKDAEIAEDARRRSEAQAVAKLVAILIEQLGYSKEDALQEVKSTGRFPGYFADDSN